MNNNQLGLLISLTAVVISALALFHTVSANRTSRKCDFGYVRYDRLTALAEDIDELSSPHDQKLAMARALYSNSNPGRTKLSDIDASKLVAELISGRLRAIPPLLRKFDLNQISLSAQELKSVRDGVKEVESKGERFMEERSGQDEMPADELYEIFDSAVSAVKLMEQVVDSGMKRTADQIRSSCG